MASTARSLRYALAILTTSLVTPSVWAHAHLTHQYPAANAQVTAAPQAITLNFSEGVETTPLTGMLFRWMGIKRKDITPLV